MSKLFKANYPGVDIQTYISAYDNLSNIAADIEREENKNKQSVLRDKLFAKCKTVYESLRPFEKTIYIVIGEDGTPLTMLPYSKEEEECLQSMYLICELYHSLEGVCDDEAKSRQKSRVEPLGGSGNSVKEVIIENKESVRPSYLSTKKDMNIDKEEVLAKFSKIDDAVLSAMERIKNDDFGVFLVLQKYIRKCFNDFNYNHFIENANKEKWSKLLSFMINDYEDNPRFNGTPIAEIPEMFSLNDFIMTALCEHEKARHLLFYNVPDCDLQQSAYDFFCNARAMQIIRVSS